MTRRVVSFGAALVIIALPLAAQAQSQSSTAGASTPATAPRVAGAPEKATGATLSGDETAKVREFVTKEKRPSMIIPQKVALGTVLPGSVKLYPFPADLGVRSDYRYTVVNEHTVLVDAGTHRITQVIN